MNRIKDCISKYTTPRDLTPENGIVFWKERVLLILLLACSALGFITWIPSVALAIKEKLWIVAAADTFMLGLVVWLFLRPQLPYGLRAGIISIIAYALGMVLIVTLGPFGAGPVWLFFFPIITAVLLGSKYGFRALVLNLITLVIVGFLIYFNQTQLLNSFNPGAWHFTAENSMGKWLVISTNFMLLNILTTLSITMILNGLRRSLDSLSLSEKKHRRIFKNILDVYFETSLEGVIMEISPSIQSISGFSQKQLKGQNLDQIILPSKNTPLLIQQLLTETRVFNHEIQMIDKTGKIKICSVNARLMKDKNNMPGKIIGIFRDITEQTILEEKKITLEKQLNQSQKIEALGLLAGGVAHDLNNVLSGIVTYPDLLLMDLPEDSPMASSLKRIRSSGDRAAGIVQDLLTLSRRGSITLEPLDMNRIIGAFLDTPAYEKIISFHPDIRVETDLKASFPQIKGSALHLEKTIMNLVSNAAEAQPQGGVIRISTENCRLDHPVKGYDQVHPGEYLVVCVEDEGQGIKPCDLKQIFEPFFTKKTMGRSGTGLGMAVVWGSVQDHQGYIEVRSHISHGTVFNLYFPVTQEDIKPPAPPIDPKILEGQGETILIVDDVRQQREILEAVLDKLCYTPIALEDGEKAVQYLKTNHAALVILDMIMDPGINGLETFRRIKEFKPDQKAIIASGFARTSQVKEALAMGAGQYIKKPYTIEKIGIAVKKELAVQPGD